MRETVPNITATPSHDKSPERSRQGAMRKLEMLRAELRELEARKTERTSFSRYKTDRLSFKIMRKEEQIQSLKAFIKRRDVEGW